MYPHLKQKEKYFFLSNFSFKTATPKDIFSFK
nr:MAG TPA: hypothetical protein [Caudoviricetes sp.]